MQENRPATPTLPAIQTLSCGFLVDQYACSDFDITNFRTNPAKLDAFHITAGERETAKTEGGGREREKAMSAPDIS